MGKIGDEGVNHVGTDFVRVKRVRKSGGDKMMSHLLGEEAAWRGVSPHNVERSHSSLPSVLPTARVQEESATRHISHLCLHDKGSPLYPGTSDKTWHLLPCHYT